MGLLKTILPIVSVLNILLNLMVMLNPAGMVSSFASTGDIKGLSAHVESPFAAYLIFQLCAARIALYSLGIVAYFRGSGMRLYVGLIFLVAGLASVYPDVTWHRWASSTPLTATTSVRLPAQRMAQLSRPPRNVRQPWFSDKKHSHGGLSPSVV